MGSGSSRFVSLGDVSRVRDWLLVALSHRVATGGQQSLRTWLTELFLRNDAAASGSVALSVVAEMAADLSLCPPASTWSAEDIAQFCAFFAREDDDSSSNVFNYELFLDYLLFPVQQARPQLEISQADTNAAGFQVGIYCQDADSGRQTDSRPVVIKEAALPSLDTRREAVALLRDAINRLRLLSHPNLVRYCSTLQCKSALYVLQTHEPKSCTLRTILESFGPMKESTVRRYLAQIIQGLLCLHSHGVPHGALSTQSVLIDSYGLLKLADFGVRRYLPSSALWDHPPEHPAVGDEGDWCLQYKPPEVDSKTSWNLKSDVWCVGILAQQMTHGWSLAPTETQSSSAPRSPRFPSPMKRVTITEADTKSPAVRRPPALPASMSKELKALVRTCLQKTPSKRATVDELLRSPYFHVNQTDATREELRTVCTDLDASIRRLLSVSSPATRARVRKDTNRRGTTGRV